MVPDPQSTVGPKQPRHATHFATMAQSIFASGAASTSPMHASEVAAIIWVQVLAGTALTAPCGVCGDCGVSPLTNYWGRAEAHWPGGLCVVLDDCVRFLCLEKDTLQDVRTPAGVCCLVRGRIMGEYGCVLGWRSRHRGAPLTPSSQGEDRPPPGHGAPHLCYSCDNWNVENHACHRFCVPRLPAREYQWERQR